MKNLSVSLRPTSMDDVIGHDSVKASISRTLASGRTPSAFMFSGPPGVGKTTLAMIVARMVQGDTPEDTALEIREVNAANENGVDDMRSLVDTSGSFPLTGRYRVIILNEAQMLTAQAQNVLLPPLEEEQSATIWIFTTTDPAKIIKPLQDRCLHFRLGGLTREGVQTLVERAKAHTAIADTTAFVKEAILRKVGSPREVLMALEKHAGGTPLTESFSGSSDHEPLYADVAKAVIAGDWNRTRQLVSGIKTADSRGLRAVVAAFMGNELLRHDFGTRADAISGCLISLSGSSFEDGLAFHGMKAALYRCAKQIAGAR